MAFVELIKTQDHLGNSLWFQIFQHDDGDYVHNLIFNGEETWINDEDAWLFKTYQQCVDHVLDLINDINKIGA